MDRRCLTDDCKNLAAPGKRFCHTCRVQKYRKTHLLRYIYLNWKGNAKRRGRIFEITYNEFVQFCINTGYDKHKGITAESLSIDCIQKEKGYTKNNIRAITLSENVRRERGSLPEEFIKDDYCPF